MNDKQINRKVVIIFILFGLLITGGISCRNQYDVAEDLQFVELVLCEGLDTERMPVGVKKSIISKPQTISICINIKTEHKHFFSVNWRGPQYSKRTLLSVEQDGWIVTEANHSDYFLPGEYRFWISLGKIQSKASITFEVVDNAQSMRSISRA